MITSATSSARPAGSRLKVGLVTPTLDPGGAERQMLILAEALPRDRFDVRFIILAHRGALADEAEHLGIPVHVLGLGTTMCRRPTIGCIRASVRAVAGYLRLARDLDVVDAWLVPAVILVGLLQPLARVPVFIAGRRSLGDVARPRSGLRRVAARLALRRARVVVANSDAAARDLIATEAVDPVRVRVIRNAVVPARRVDGTSVRGRLGFGAGDLVIGCVARLQPGKGLEDVIAAATGLRGTWPQMRWLIVGNGPLGPALEREVRGRRLEGVVVLHRQEADARTLYPAMDILVQASHSEGLPNVILEGAAAGLPIVATAVGGTVEILEDGRTGLLIPPKDPILLAEAVARLAADVELRRRLGVAAARRSGEFSPAALAEAVGQLYLSLTALQAPLHPSSPHADL